MVGAYANSFGIDSYGNIQIEGKENHQGFTFHLKEEDVVGCGLDVFTANNGIAQCRLFFTKNGALISKFRLVIFKMNIFQINPFDYPPAILVPNYFRQLAFVFL